MGLNKVPSGKNIPEDIYVIIEIMAYSNPVKYEVDKKSGVLFINRFISAPMFYPCNYGYINNTLCLDNDPLDVLIPTPYPIYPGTVIHCRPVGILNMIDESGEDAKLLAVPYYNLSKEYDDIKDINDISSKLLDQIIHFFKHYKELEKKKWVKIKGWGNINEAKNEINISIKRYKKNTIQT